MKDVSGPGEGWGQPCAPGAGAAAWPTAGTAPGASAWEEEKSAPPDVPAALIHSIITSHQMYVVYFWPQAYWKCKNNFQAAWNVA